MRAGLAAAGMALALAACSASPPLPSVSQSPSSGGVPSTAATTPPGMPDDVPPADDVRAAGTAVTSGGLTLSVLPWWATGTGSAGGAASGVVTIEGQPDGSAAFTVPFSADGATSAAAYIASPVGSTVEVLDDGSVVVRKATGGFLGGLAPAQATSAPGAATDVLASYQTAGPDLLRVAVSTVSAVPPGTAADPPTVAVTGWLGTAAVESLTWGEREGGRSLAVVPTAWTRAAGKAGAEGAWAAVVAQEPEVRTASMHNQLRCHTIGASNKASWNLEPWRPDVGLIDTLEAGCNPT